MCVCVCATLVCVCLQRRLLFGLAIYESVFPQLNATKPTAAGLNGRHQPQPKLPNRSLLISKRIAQRPPMSRGGLQACGGGGRR